MNFLKVLEIMKDHMECPECGNKYIGNGQGSLVIDENSFSHTCKCGWSIIIEDEE